MVGSKRIRSAFVAMVAIGAAQVAVSQDTNPARSERGVFVTQAQNAPEAADQSAVYGPTPDVRLEINGAAATIEKREDGAVTQVSPRMARTNSAPLNQLTRGDFGKSLAQLSDAEKTVLAQAIEGTDICDNPPDLAAIRELCAQRLETRSGEFATSSVQRLSPEERLLGEGTDDDRTATLEEAISRLARNQGNALSDADQAIASVALSTGGTLSANPAPQSGPSESQLSAETQALISAIVEQFSASTGGN